MIERRAEFIRELDSLCENIVNCGELNYDEEKMEERFLYQSSASPENIECIKIPYGCSWQPCWSFSCSRDLPSARRALPVVKYSEHLV